MRRTETLSPAYFERIFRNNLDPWQFETSPYEKAKFDRTIAALAGRTYRYGLEVGCATGVLTVRLAEICELLDAVDVSKTALSRAHDRCREKTNVHFECKAFPPSRSPDYPYDLIVLSEVVYYWSDQDLETAAAWLRGNSTPGCPLLLVHWTGETDYPQTGDEATAKLRALLGPSAQEVMAERSERYRLDLWQLGPVGEK
jgi:predicted TPR repeat methyltransferase